MSHGFKEIPPGQFDRLLAEKGLVGKEWGSPIFQHDCEACIFLGSFLHDEEIHDLYYCPGKLGGGSVVYRYGDEGYEYGSMSLSIVLMRDYPGDDNAYHIDLRRIFENRFYTFEETKGEIQDRRFRVKISVVEVFEHECPECYGGERLGGDPENCPTCHGANYITEEKPL